MAPLRSLLFSFSFAIGNVLYCYQLFFANSFPLLHSYIYPKCCKKKTAVAAARQQDFHNDGDQNYRNGYHNDEYRNDNYDRNFEDEEWYAQHQRKMQLAIGDVNRPKPSQLSHAAADHAIVNAARKQSMQGRDNNDYHESNRKAPAKKQYDDFASSDDDE